MLQMILLEVLSDAADEITTELAPGWVSVRLRGREPEFEVFTPAIMTADDVTRAAAFPPAHASPRGEPAADTEEREISRIALPPP